MRFLAPVVVVSLVFAALACSADATTASEPAGADAGGTGAGGADGGGGGKGDAGVDTQEAGVDLTPTKQTNAKVTIDGISRQVDRGQFGVTAADGTFYIEAHSGGVAECPEKETPKWTLIVNGVPKGEPGKAFTEADGVTVSFLDFSGELIADPPPTRKATAATVTLIASKNDDSVEVEVEATFSDGGVKGRVYATYCAAMSE